MGFLSGILDGISQSLRHERFEKSLEGAIGGDPIEQCEVGESYELGCGVEKNETEAVKWYSKSAEQMNARAMYKLGCFYKDGKSVPQDYQKAYEYFHRNLGELYENLCNKAQNMKENTFK